MNALSELPSDLTTPLGGPDLLYWFDAVVDARCTPSEFSIALPEVCRHDPEAAKEALLLLDHFGNTGKLRVEDFRPLEQELQRLALGGLALHPQAGAAGREPSVPVQSTASPSISEPWISESADALAAPLREIDPTRAFIDEAADEEQFFEPQIDVTRIQPQIDEARVEPRVDATPAHASPQSADELIDDGFASESASEESASARVLRGRYVLLEELGLGGMGTVYRALDRNRAGLPRKQQYIAVKVLRDEYARRPEALKALRREFHQAQSLSHPGIVNVFDFDQDDGVYFVTMELLDGEPLASLMRRVLPNRLAREPALTILRELGDAMGYAHARDVLHLDLKPGNVMITLQGHVRVLDFGLAQTFMPEPWISEPAPSFNAATPAYASCERLSGEIPDVRDDIFSYACIAYELLSGRHPFERHSALDAKNERRKPRRISSLSRRQWQTLKSALSPDREERPESMEAVLEGMSLLEGPATWSPRASTSYPRRSSSPWLVAAGLAALAVLAYVGWTRMPPGLQDAVAEQTSALGTTLATTGSEARTWARAQYATWTERDRSSAVPTPNGGPAAIAASEPQVPGSSGPGAAIEPGNGTFMAPVDDADGTDDNAAAPSAAQAAPTPESPEPSATGSGPQSVDAEPSSSTAPAPAPTTPANGAPSSSATPAAVAEPAAGTPVADPRTTDVATHATPPKTGGGPGEDLCVLGGRTRSTNRPRWHG
jgi:serine/threonine protein kinase